MVDFFFSFPAVLQFASIFWPRAKVRAAGLGASILSSSHLAQQDAEDAALGCAPMGAGLLVNREEGTPVCLWCPRMGEGCFGMGSPRPPRMAAFGYRGDCATAGGLCSRRKVTCHFSIHLSPSRHLSITHSHQPGEIPGALGVPTRPTPRRGDPQLGEDPRCRLCPRAVIFSQTDGPTDGDAGSPCVPALLCRGSAILRGAGHKSRGHS